MKEKLMRTALVVALLAAFTTAQGTEIPRAVSGASALAYVTSNEPDGDLFRLTGIRGRTYVFHHSWPSQRGAPHEFWGSIWLKNKGVEDLYIHHPDGTVTGPVAPGAWIEVDIADKATPLEVKGDESVEYEVKDENGEEEGSFSINGTAQQATSAGGEGGVINLPDRAASPERAAGTTGG